MGIQYGYLVGNKSSKKWATQLNAIKDFGVEESCLVMEEAARGAERPAFEQLTEKLTAGDILVVASLDGLGRNYKDIFDCWSLLSKQKGVDLVVLDMPVMSTYSPNDLMRPVVTDLVLQSFTYLFAHQRKNAHDHQAECIEAAKDRGIQFGRPRLNTPEEFAVLAAQCRDGDISAQEAAQRLNISRTTFWRRMREYDAQQKAARS